MQQENLVTILMATYNGEKYLVQQLESIIEQTHQNWRIFISDDGSEDGTMDLIKDYQKKYPEKMKLFDSGHRFGSACGNFFFLLQQAVDNNSEYIMFCDQDDVWIRDKIALTLNEMKNTEEKTKPKQPVLVFTDLEVVDEHMSTISSSFMQYSKLRGDRIHLNYLLAQNVVTGCTAMANLHLGKLSLKFLDKQDILMHDWWMALVAAAFGSIVYIDSKTVKYRQHSKNAVGAKNVNNLKYLLKKVFFENNIRNSMGRSMLQAKQFYNSYQKQLNLQDCFIVKGFGELSHYNKLYRIAFIIKYKMLKFGFFRKIAQIIWI